MANVYFELTRRFNREEPTAILASGQAVVFHRRPYIERFGRTDLSGLPLEQAHRRVCELAGQLLPRTLESD